MAAPNERRQFRILNRDFLSRVVDVELIAASGDTRAIIVRFAAILLAFNGLVAYMIVPRYAMSAWAHARLAFLARNDEEFLLSTTVAVAGFFAVMSWNSVFPDRRDSLILGLLPVKIKTMILARVSAMATVLAAAIVATNGITGIALPFALAEGFFDGVRSLVTFWITLGAAGIFTFCTAIAIQGLAGQLLPWRTFMRVSGLLQIAALFTVLGFFFLTPPITDPDPPLYIPSFWFTGLLHVLRGDSDELMRTFAAHGLLAMAIVVPLAALVYILSWSRNIRRIVESPEILPAKNPRFANFLARTMAPAPFERAILQFSARTIARSRQHRLLLAIYGGFGFSLVFVFTRSILTSNRGSMAWSMVNVPFLLAGVLLLTFAVVAVRAVFAFPIALAANWIFRITAVHRPSAYFAAVRRTLFTLAALPLWAAAALFYLSLWPRTPAMEHVALLFLLGVILVERSLYQFRKVPFTCSWLPGGANRSMKAGMYILFFLALSSTVMAIELWTLAKVARIVVLLSLFGLAAVFSRRRTVEFANDPYNRLQFEDSPPQEIYALDLRQDGAWSGDEAYVEAIDPTFGRSLRERSLRFVLCFALLVTAGFIYERVGEARDRREYPQIGRSFDIGGRSLNLYCSGEGSPTVVFESNIGVPGYTWTLIQRMTSTFTRACWYDRSGYGWSDPGPAVNHSDTIGADLHRLLRVARIGPPYVLVGHAMGAFHNRVFRGQYPGEVAGLVLVDPMSEDLTANIGDDFALFRPAMLGVQRAFAEIGVFRFLAPDATRLPWGITPKDWATLAALQLQPWSMQAAGRELPLVANGDLARAAGAFGDIPTVVLTAAKRSEEEDEDLIVDPALKLSLHKRIAALSTQGEDVIVRNSGHQIPTEEPTAVIDAVEKVVRKIRNTRP